MSADFSTMVWSTELGRSSFPGADGATTVRQASKGMRNVLRMWFGYGSNSDVNVWREMCRPGARKPCCTFLPRAHAAGPGYSASSGRLTILTLYDHAQNLPRSASEV